MLNVWFFETSSASLSASVTNLSLSSAISVDDVRHFSTFKGRSLHPSEKNTKSTLLAEDPETRRGTTSNGGGEISGS